MTAMEHSVCTALIHYPVTDKRGDLVSTSVTNLDIHDISRAARTYGLKRYFLVTPIEAQHWLARRVVAHWEKGWGAQYNPNRKDALSLIQVKSDIGEVAEAITAEFGQPPLWVATSAKTYPNSVTFAELRKQIVDQPSRPICLLFGTGHGIHPELMLEADVILEPIQAGTGYNHLSVRSAASIIFDRLLAPQS